MRILIAPDKFKDSLSVFDVCRAMEEGVMKYDKSIDVEIHPLADGGEGSLDVIRRYVNCDVINGQVKNPVGNTIDADFLYCNGKAYIELAKASGLELLSHKERNPMLTGTFGTGQQILQAIDMGAKEINVFLGGSATNDAAIGIAAALGIEFFDSEGRKLEPVGANLNRISYIDNSNLLYDYNKLVFNVFSDVLNPVYGKNGAAYVFAGQKGASEESIKILDDGLRHFSKLMQKFYGKDISRLKGGGAAGGVAAGLYAMLDAGIKSGIDEITNLTGLEQKVKEADIVITGEGRLDINSFNGKVVGKVVDLAKKYEKKVFTIVGENSLNGAYNKAEDTIIVDSIIQYARNKADAIDNAFQYIAETVFRLLSSRL